MAIKQAESQTKNPAEYLGSKVRRHLEDGQRVGAVGISSCVGTYGTTISAFRRLAENGAFSGGQDDYMGRFHITPNLQNRDLLRSSIGDEIARARQNGRLAINPLFISIEHASSKEVSQIGEEVVSELSDDEGVVIGFNVRALKDPLEFYVDEIREEPEVILPEPPRIEAVYSIYPVNELAAVAVQKVFEQVKS